MEHIYYKLLDELANNLYGVLSIEGNSIKWEYDGLNQTLDDIESHLIDISENDKLVIEELLENEGYLETINITDNEIDDTIVKFYLMN